MRKRVARWLRLAPKIVQLDFFRQPVKAGISHETFNDYYWIRVYWYKVGFSISNLTMYEFCEALRYGLIYFRIKT